PAAGPVVAELFTSQGCSSCPPADALFVELARRSDVIALTFNVDYWDYIGWRDVFARPDYGKRAAAYVKALKLQSPYTPQIVIHGRKDLGGQSQADVMAAIKAHAAPPATQVGIAHQNGQLAISIGPGTKPAAAATVWLFRTLSLATVEIKAGENRGRSITYANVVRSMENIGTWSGQPVTLNQTLQALSDGPAPDGVAVLVQAGEGGPILAGRHIKL
ncbi:MAG TPA: DUF1223 domain-containing protein, partial [Alphaproteobacteria bacterium]|nr:DUF1223 domain-containing protein [Alphaproteobacteria bacterium]